MAKRERDVSKKIKPRRSLGACIECGESAYWRAKLKPNVDKWSPLCPKHYMRFRRQGSLKNTHRLLNETMMEYIKGQVEDHGRSFADIARELGVDRTVVSRRYREGYTDTE